VDDRKLQLFPVAVDIQPRQLTAMCCYDDVTVAAGDRYGNVVLLRLPDDVVAHYPWRVSHPPERGVHMPLTGHLIRVASYHTGETITGLTRHGPALFYSTLLGQIGAFVPIAADEDYFWLATTEALAERIGAREFGFFEFKKVNAGKVSVVSADPIEMIESLDPEYLTIVEEELKLPKMQLLGLIARLKTGRAI
jgi:hypothetical protein